MSELQRDLAATIESYHQSVGEFSGGDPEPVKSLLSNAADVMLANPFGPAVRGQQPVRDALDFASSRFRDGTVERFEQLAVYATDDLATIHELEHWQSKVGGSPEMTPFVLRVSTTLRREQDGWRLVARHADPIATPDPRGPLRG